MATASPSIRSPVSAADSSQSATADRLLTTSPTPAQDSCPGALRTRSRSTTTATGETTPYEPLPDSCSRELTGEAIPSCDRLVATATIGMPAMCAANLVTSMVLPPPMPAEPARAGLTAVAAPEHFGGIEPQVRHDGVALAGTDRDGDPAIVSDPPVSQQGAKAGDRARPDIDDQRRGKHPGQQRHRSPLARLKTGGTVLARLAARGNLAGTPQVGVVVHLDPFPRADRRGQDPATPR